ncbi:MAG: winged helix-turn-helix transcriptional regulator [Lentisphaerae bacterium]|nr:winged helix-turn-helix transcriptional regulator [Lentisphaerota bacterium]
MAPEIDIHCRAVTSLRLTAVIFDLRGRTAAKPACHSVHLWADQRHGRPTARTIRSEPEFRYEQTGLWVEFGFPRSGVEPTAETLEKTSVESSVISSGISSEKTASKIVELMRDTPNITIPKIAERLGKTTRAIEKRVRQLKKGAVIGRVGPDKGAPNAFDAEQFFPFAKRIYERKGAVSFLVDKTKDEDPEDVILACMLLTDLLD